MIIKHLGETLSKKLISRVIPDAGVQKYVIEETGNKFEVKPLLHRVISIRPNSKRTNSKLSFFTKFQCVL